jgi:ribonucleoside-diphosphate reductase alpha chain
LKRSGPRDAIDLRPQDYAIERPQDMWMRIACAIHMNRHRLDDETVLKDVQETYDLLSLGKIMHATPTLYNMGTLSEQALSCFLLGGADSIEGIGKIKSDAMKISKYAGGIGFWWDLRCAGSEVKSTNGISDGPIPFLAAFERDMIATNQGGKRPGSAASYMEPAHPDFMKWVRLRRPGEENRIDKLFYAAYIPDIFMKYCEADKDWYFIDPNDYPYLYTLYGEEYEREYERIVFEEGGYIGEPIKARKVFMEICITQTETGMPYITFKDAANIKSNYKEYCKRPGKAGLIKCSNLCNEILEYSDKDEYGCCCLGTVCLNKHIDPTTGEINYEEIAYNAGVLTKNLNKIIDINFYPVEETKTSNMIHRPLAIGIQGLADLFHIKKVAFTSPEARLINKQCMEAIYYGACNVSNMLAREFGPCESFAGSPMSQGQFQFDMWDAADSLRPATSLMWPQRWSELRENVIKYGMRNLQLTGLPPTASTSHIQGNNECHEPFMSNITTRKTLSGEFIVINQYLVKELQEMGIWNSKTRIRLITDRGSVQSWDFIPEEMRERYKTVWEWRTEDLIDMDAERAPFVDQTQSSNRFMVKVTIKRLIAMHMRAWRAGLKTGMYYLRSLSNSKAQQFTLSNRVEQSSTLNSVKVIDVKNEESPKKEDSPKTEEGKKVDEILEEMSCELKKINGVMCYSCS